MCTANIDLCLFFVYFSPYLYTPQTLTNQKRKTNKSLPNRKKTILFKKYRFI